MRKLHLICPAHDLYKNMSGRNFHSPALMAVSAVTPPDWEIVITQVQKNEKMVYHDDVDVVGITMMTNQAVPGYRIAEEYRARGKKVVLGGIHPSVLPEEAIQYADAVVVGEAEEIWEGVLDDLVHDRSRGIYRRERFPNMAEVPPFRHDLFTTRGNSFSVSMIQVTRGCPFNCDFCSATKLFGKKFRMRPIPNVIREIESTGNSVIFFLDDNVVGNLQYSKDLFRAMIPLKRRWIGQASLNVFSRPDIVQLAARSGCTGVFLGIESIQPDNLKISGSFSKNKFASKEELAEKLKRIVDAGIIVMGSLIFGLDHDTPDVFERTVDFLVENDVTFSSLPILTPYPGSQTFEQMKKENRIFSYDWNLYNNENPVFIPAGMSPTLLKLGADWASYEFCRPKHIPRRVRRHYDIPLFMITGTLAWHIECRKKYKRSWEEFERIRKNGYSTGSVGLPLA